MTMTALQSILEIHLAEFATNESLRVAWPNMAFSRQDNETYLVVNNLPASLQASAIDPDAQDVLTGIYQIDVIAPSGNGWAPSAAVIDGLRSHFSRGLKLTATGIELTVIRTQQSPAKIDDGTHYRVPVDVVWRVSMDKV
jgi:hypothetical protein